MTTKNVGIEFTLSGLQATEAGIDKITGQLTGLENLTGNMNVRGLQTLNKSIKDLVGNFAGLRSDLSSLTSNLNNVNTSLTGVAEKLSTAVDKMSTGTRQGMRVAKEATEQTAKAISSAAKQAESDISHLNDAVAKQQAKANDFMSSFRYRRNNADSAANHRIMLTSALMTERSAEKQRQADQRAAEKALRGSLAGDALMDRLRFQATKAKEQELEKNRLRDAGKDLTYNFNAVVNPAAQMMALKKARLAHESGFSPEQMSNTFGPKLSSIATDTAKYKAELASVQKAVAAAEEAHLRFGRTGHDVFRGLTSGVGMIWLSWGQILPMITGFAASAGVRAMLQVGSQFEHQMKVIQALSQETSGALGTVQSQLLSMSSGSMFALNDMVGGLKALTQAGFNTQDAMKNLKTVMNLSLLGETSPEQSALFLAGLRNTFKNDPTISDNNGNVDLAQAANITAIAAARSQTSINEMMESMKQASSVADVYNLRLTDVSVALQLLAERNITGSAAGTSTRNALEALTGRTEKARKALQQLGVSLYDTKTGTTRNAFDVLADIREKMAGFSDMKRNRFIQSFADERSKKLIEAFLAKSDAEIRDMRAQTFRAGENGGFVTKGAEDINTGLQALSGQTLNTFRAAAVETFKEINPGLKELMGNLKQLAGGSEMRGGLTALANGFLTISQVGVGAITLLAKVGPALVGLGGGFVAARALTAVGTGLMSLQTAASSGTLLAGLATRFPLITAAVASLTTPIGLLTAALMAGGAAWMYFSNKGDEAAERLSAAKTRIEGLGASLATIRADSYVKFNQSEPGQGASIGESIDHSLNQQLSKIEGQKSALQNLAAIDQEFRNRSSEAGKAATEDDVERELFLTDRRRSFLKQQLDEYRQFLRAKGISDDESHRTQLGYVDKIKQADDQYYEYQLQLSKLRIEQTRKEVLERNKWYMMLGLGPKSGDEADMATPKQFVGDGYARASVGAVSSKLYALHNEQVAGKDVSSALPGLQVELETNLQRVEAVVADYSKKLADKEAERSGWLAAYRQRNGGKEPPANSSALDKLNGDVNFLANKKGEAQRLQTALRYQIEGSPNGTGVSIASLRNRQTKITEEKYAKTVKPKPTDMSDLPDGREPREKKGTSLLSLVDEYSGEDRGVSKLLQAMKSGPGTDDYKTQLEEYKNLLSQDGESGEFARQAGSFEAYRVQLHEYITKHKTLQARLDRSLDAAIRGVQDETARIEKDAIPEGASNATSALIVARRNLQRKFEDEQRSELEKAKSPATKQAVKRAFAGREAEYDAASEKQLVTRLDDIVKGVGNKARESDAASLTQLRTEIARQESEAMKPVRELATVMSATPSWLGGQSTGGKDGQAGFSLSTLKSWVTSGIGASDFQHTAEMENATIKRKQREQEAILMAEKEFGLKGLDEADALYAKQKEAHDAFLAERLANIKQMYDEEAAAANSALERTKTFSFQGALAMNTMFKSMQSPAEVFSSTAVKGMQQLQKAFYDSARGAKLSFKDIRNGFRDLMIDMLAQMAANKAMEATMGLVGMGLQALGTMAGSYFGSLLAPTPTAVGFSSGTIGSGVTAGGGTGFTTGGGVGLNLGGGSTVSFGPSFDVGTVPTNLDVPSASASFLPHRAAGGAVSAGSPYMVGEQGWEIFVPDTSGNVVPNNVARNLAGGGGNDVYNVNVTIVDQTRTEQTSGKAESGSTAADLGKQIKAAVMEVLIEQKRSGGVLSR